jgi:predicted Zn-dependent peptidase
VLHELREKPVSNDELERAKKAFIAEFIYEMDSQSSLAGATARG